MVGLTNAKGSWEIRGRQLGTAIGARVTTFPTAADWRWADLCIVIKRAWIPFALKARQARVPMVWDALDFWKQPAENSLSELQARALLKHTIAQVRPALTICATEAQAAACGGIYLPHHSRPGLVPTPVRETVATVAYEGNPAYLGRWGHAIKAECERRGWAFVLNPHDLAQADLVVAFRDGPWDGWMPRQWKSGVKAVNAMAAGRPFLAQLSAAGEEIGPIGSTIEQPAHLRAVFDAWCAETIRSTAVTTSVFVEPVDYTLESVAARYRQILQTVGQTCAA